MPEDANLTRAEFLFLTALFDGTARTFEEMAAEIGWRVCQAHFSKIVWRHSQYGWIERGRFEQRTRRNGKTIRRQRSAYRITEAGRRVWNETADFWLFTIKQATGKAKRRKRARPEREFRVDPLRYRAPRPDRRPTPEEAERLFNGAPAGFVLFCRAIWTNVFSLDELRSLRVEDVDLAAGRLFVSLQGHRKRLPIAPELRPLIQNAIGERRAGPVFCNRIGRAWTAACACKNFARQRRAAGLPDEIALQGHRGTGGRHRAAS